MYWFSLIMSSLLLGVGLAMDAFSVSLANGLGEPKMKLKKAFGIASIFAIFQAIMPLIGWVAISGFTAIFNKFEPFIPWIAFILLCFIGAKMLIDAIKSGSDEEANSKPLTFIALIVQAVATSIDALTAGIDLARDYTIRQYGYVLLAVAIIAVVTFIICISGVKLGQRVGTKLANKAGILGGCVLIFLGLKILLVDIIFA